MHACACARARARVHTPARAREHVDAQARAQRRDVKHCPGTARGQDIHVQACMCQPNAIRRIPAQVLRD
eukprot:857131-Alexandrium_andersonii.AAC.1